MQVRTLVALLAALLTACSGSSRLAIDSSTAAGNSTAPPTAATPGMLSLTSGSAAVAQNAGSSSISVNRSGGSSGTVSVHYATANGSAVAGADFAAASGDLSWADGDAATKTFAIAIANSSPFSGTRTFTVALSAPTGNATLGAVSSTSITISGDAVTAPVPSGNIAIDAHILIDQFGYRPADPKVAVIRTPKVGYDAAAIFNPGTTYQLRNAADNSVTLSAALTEWNGGATESDSGDAGWWFDFSTVAQPGSYYVYDPINKVRSPIFPIAQTVYANILKAAVRMYYYQRAGIAKTAPFAELCWQDTAAYMGPNQDTQAHDITDPTNAAKIKDVSGGWFDAGDVNKYLTNASVPVHQLLTAYQENPGVFTDDFNIPESGNGVPDIVDEVKWEVDWVKRMQFPDGSVALKVGDTAFVNQSPPSVDQSARFYVPSCTSSTIAAAGMYAHASYVYAGIKPLEAEAATLKTAAINAWNNYQGIPAKQTSCDSGKVLVAKADWPVDLQDQEAVVAAIYLFAISGDSKYGDYVKANYQLLRPYHDVGWMRYQPHQGQALLFYTTLSTADATLKKSILAAKLADTLAGNDVYGVSATSDLYRNHLADYVWGSNQVRANYGDTNTEVATYHIAVSATASYQTRALDTLHYFHGVNPFALVYVSNMYGPDFGATNSVNELLHAWFAPNGPWNDAKTSTCGPAPGYMPGGPNLTAGAAGVPATEVPPVGQPAQKSYKDWNGSDFSWVVNEPGIYYQSAYVQLLSAFAR
jgi:endoglucanase